MAIITEPLASQMDASNPDEMLEVIVEVKPTVVPQSLPRQEKIARMRDAFENGIVELEEQIGRFGGRVLERAWINGTLKAIIPARTIERIADLEGVDVLDVPRTLTRD